MAAHGLAQIMICRQGIAGKSLDRAAQIAGRGDAKRPAPGGQTHAGDVFARQRARRAEAVVIAILLVAQRHAIQGKAELLGGETMDHQGFILLVIAPGIGGLIDHPRQGVDRLERG